MRDREVSTCKSAKEGYTGKVTPVHRCAGSEGQNHADILRVLITGSKSSTCKGPEVGASLMWSRDTREATVAGVAGEGRAAHVRTRTFCP